MVCEMTALNYLLVVCGFRPNPKFMFLPFLVERSTDKTSQALHKQHTGTDNTTKTDNKSLPITISAITDHDVTRQLFRFVKCKLVVAKSYETHRVTMFF